MKIKGSLHALFDEEDSSLIQEAIISLNGSFVEEVVTLSILFRTSDSWYNYFLVPFPLVYDFTCTESKGAFFNTYIKGSFDYEKSTIPHVVDFS